MKKLLLTLVALCLAFTLSAQKITDVVRLKNGSVMRGTITEKTRSGIKLTLKDGSVFVYRNAEIESMEQEIREKFFDFETPAEKKLNFGVSAGYLYSSALFISREVASSGNRHNHRFDGRHGFTVGAVSEYRMSVGLGIGLGVKYSMGGFGSDGSTDINNLAANGMKFTRHTIDIPVVANVYMGQGKKGFVQAGVNTSILVAGSAALGGYWNIGDQSTGSTMNPVVMQVILGGGYGPFSAQLYWGVTSMWTSEFRNNFRLPANEEVRYNSTIGVSVSYTYMF
jgi:hypothetical protein